jgi:hypothetical protein
MNKIHFAAVVAPDLDYDLMLKWVAHYYNLQLDSYTIFIHKEHDKKHPEVKSYFDEFGFKVSYCHGDWQDGKLRANVLNGFNAALPENDYIMTADSDEFQMWPNDDVRHCLFHGEIDAIFGNVVDRYDKTLHSASNEGHLEDQFPYEIDSLENEFISSSNTGMIRNHICVNKCKVPVCFVGSHDLNSALKNTGNQFFVRGGLKILHYKWRATIKEKLATKTYYSHNVDKKLKKFFQE